MTAAEKLKALKFECFTQYDETNVFREVADWDDLGNYDDIAPLSDFMDYLVTLIAEAGHDAPYLYLRSTDAADSYQKRLSVVFLKPKTPEELARLVDEKRQRQEREARLAVERERNLYLYLKTKFEA